MGSRGWIVFGVGLATAGILWPGECRSQNVQGYGQIQFQEFEGNNVTRQSLVSILQLDYATRWRERLDVRSQLELRRVSALGRPEEDFTPRGLLQVSHTDFGVSAQFRPRRVTDALGITTNQEEAVISGYLTRPGLPRGDFSWTRRHRAPGGASGGETTGLTRNARLAQRFGPLDLQVGYGDIVQEPRDASLRRTSQQTLDGTMMLQIASGPRGSAGTRYTYSDNRGEQSSGATVRTIIHDSSTSGAFLISRKSDVTLMYNYRRSELTGQPLDHLNDHDGTLLFNVRPTAGIRLSAGSGVRTARVAEREDVLGSLILTASADGAVRPGWQGITSASHTISRFPDGQTFAVDTWRGGSQFRLNRRLDLNADLTLSSTGDTAAVNNRAVFQATYGFNAIPLPSVRVTWSGRVYRVGPELGRAAAHSVGSTLDLRWQPVPTVEWSGSMSEASPLAGGAVPLQTRQLRLRVTPGRSFQWDATWSRSDQVRGDVGSADLRGREIVESRAYIALARLTRLTAVFSVADPGRKPTRVTQYDLLLTQNFGR